MTIVNDIWGQDPERGHIRDVQVEDITVCGRAMPPSRLAGFDAEHAIHGVAFRNVRRAGQPPAADAQALRLTRNAHVHGLTIEAGRA